MNVFILRNHNKIDVHLYIHGVDWAVRSNVGVHARLDKCSFVWACLAYLEFKALQTVGVIIARVAVQVNQYILLTLTLVIYVTANAQRKML